MEVEDLPAINTVLSLSDYQYLPLLIQCVQAADAVKLTYPVKEASQLENFLREIGHDVPWFEELFAWTLPVQDQNDFIEKARIAVQQWLVILQSQPGPRDTKE